MGRENCIRRLRDRLAIRKEHGEVPALRQLRRQRDVQSMLVEIAKAYRVTKEELLRPGTKGNEARAVAMVVI